MNTKKILTVIGFGFLSWLVPFVASILFYTPQGELLVAKELFKSIMIVVGGLVGVTLLVKYFNSYSERPLRWGVIVGVSWLLINWVLDILVLLPMAQMTIGNYFGEIGLRYLLIPMIAIGMGFVLEKK